MGGTFRPKFFCFFWARWLLREKGQEREKGGSLAATSACCSTRGGGDSRGGGSQSDSDCGASVGWLGGAVAGHLRTEAAVLLLPLLLHHHAHLLVFGVVIWWPVAVAPGPAQTPLFATAVAPGLLLSAFALLLLLVVAVVALGKAAVLVAVRAYKTGFPAAGMGADLALAVTDAAGGAGCAGDTWDSVSGFRLLCCCSGHSSESIVVGRAEGSYRGDPGNCRRRTTYLLLSWLLGTSTFIGVRSREPTKSFFCFYFLGLKRERGRG